MSRKHHLNKAEQAYHDYLQSCPDWYWVHGLHDAAVLSITSAELLPDYSRKDPLYNRMEILLDCAGALFETDITKIVLYNRKILAGSLPDWDRQAVWWFSDRLSKTPNGKYVLELELTAGKNDIRSVLQIEFLTAEVFRE